MWFAGAGCVPAPVPCFSSCVAFCRGFFWRPVCGVLVSVVCAPRVVFAAVPFFFVGGLDKFVAVCYTVLVGWGCSPSVVGWWVAVLVWFFCGGLLLWLLFFLLLLRRCFLWGFRPRLFRPRLFRRLSRRGRPRSFLPLVFLACAGVPVVGLRPSGVRPACGVPVLSLCRCSFVSVLRVPVVLLGFRSASRLGLRCSRRSVPGFLFVPALLRARFVFRRFALVRWRGVLFAGVLCWCVSRRRSVRRVFLPLGVCCLPRRFCARPRLWAFRPRSCCPVVCRFRRVLLRRFLRARGRSLLVCCASLGFLRRRFRSLPRVCLVLRRLLVVGRVPVLLLPPVPLFVRLLCRPLPRGCCPRCLVVSPRWFCACPAVFAAGFFCARVRPCPPRCVRRVVGRGVCSLPSVPRHQPAPRRRIAARKKPIELSRSI